MGETLKIAAGEACSEAGTGTTRVLLIHTGGTIGMRPSPRGYVPSPGFLAERIAQAPQLHDSAFPPFTTPPSRFGRRVQYHLVEYDPLVDSANIRFEDWARIARDIAAAYNEHDAFVVLHGTDTMAYTASALSFMLEGLGKSVILTGAQIPLSQSRNDAIDNLLGALTVAGHFDIPEVGLYFHEQLLRGNRAQKWDASGLDAFRSGNFPPLVTLGVDFEVNWHALRPPAGAALRVHTELSHDVAALRVFPGITPMIIENVLRPPIRGMVLETYGTGNAPDNDPKLLDALRRAVDRGVIIVNVTQCHRGMVSREYAAGTALGEAGVIMGADMTPEAALTKLSYLLGTGLAHGEVVELMPRDLRGELTETTGRLRFPVRLRP